jgi:hypothetical protein
MPRPDFVFIDCRLFRFISGGLALEMLPVYAAGQALFGEKIIFR